MKIKSIKTLARIGGMLYLIIIIFGLWQELYVRGSIIVAADAAARARNLRSMELLWRFGIASELLLAIITIVLGFITYILTRPVSKDLALLALIFNIVAIAVETGYSLQLVEALFPLGNHAELKAFTPGQLYGLTSLSIFAHSIGFAIALFLFSPFFLVTGYLVYSSGYFPKALGILYMIPGLCYFSSSLALIIAPAFASRYYFVLVGSAFIGELSFCLWLLIMGVNSVKWENTTRSEGNIITFV